MFKYSINKVSLKNMVSTFFNYNSFCVLSSLIDNRINNYKEYINQTRGICYKMFCSDKSLTIKIKNDYIVCPRSGGKIKVKNYEGYLLCPDYNLICSGTVICNNMFDCVEKKSLLKEVIYDYKIKTTQNLIESERKGFFNNSYELSSNGICPQYCIQCNETNECIHWGDTSVKYEEEEEDEEKEKEKEKENKKEDKKGKEPNKSKEIIIIIIFF